MNAVRCALICIAFLLAVPPAHAEGFTGIDLYRICSQSDRETFNESACVGYIRGFAEGYYEGITFGVLAERSHRRPCYPQAPAENPPDVTQSELIVKKFMTDHPEKLNQPALFVVQQALGSAFSCRK
jgi:hypothetical protein